MGFRTQPEPTPHIGRVLKTGAEGRGISTEEALAAVTWSDLNVNHEQTIAIFDPQHLASARVAEKLGYGNKSTNKYGNGSALVMTRQKRGSTSPAPIA